MLLLAFPGPEGSSFCLGSGDWPLDPHEILMNPHDLDKLRVPAFGYVAINRTNGSGRKGSGGRRRRSATGDEDATHCGTGARMEDEECEKPIAFCRAVPDDSLAAGETRAPAWLLGAAGVRPRQHLSVSRCPDLREAEKMAMTARATSQQGVLPRFRVHLSLELFEQQPQRPGSEDAGEGGRPVSASDRNLPPNIHNSSGSGSGSSNSNSSRAIARRVSGCMVRAGSLLAAEVLGETVVLRVVGVSGGNDEVNAPARRPLIISSGTEVSLKQTGEPEGLRSPTGSWSESSMSLGGEQSRRRRRRQRQEQHHCSAGDGHAWAGQAPGLEAALSELHALVLLSVDASEKKNDSRLGWSNILPSGIALCGPSGVGKTLLLDVLAEELSRSHGIHVIRLLGPQILAASVQGGGGEGSGGGGGGGRVDSATSALLRGPLGLSLAEARSRAPSVLVLDELDALFDACGGQDGGGGGGGAGPLGEGARANAALLQALDRASAIEGLVVLGATRRSPGGKGGAGWAGLEEGDSGGDGAALPAALRKPGRFDRCVTIGPPTQAQREGILRVLLSSSPARGGADWELEPLVPVQARPSAVDPAGGTVCGGRPANASRAGVGPELEGEEPRFILVENADMGGGRGEGRASRRREASSGLGAERRREASNGGFPKDTVAAAAPAAAVATAVEWAKRLSSVTPGMVAGDLERLVRTARARADKRRRQQHAVRPTGQPLPPSVLTWNDAMGAVAVTVPRSLRGLDVASSGSSGEGGGGGPNWASVGGFSEAKRRLQRLVQWPWLHPEAFARMGVSAPAGALLHGPSGCGKSLVAQVLATECLANFLWVRSSELLSRYLGETEAKLRGLFSRARAAAPCILFLDELDAITANRGGDGGGGDGEGEGGGGAGSVHARVLSTLLNEMDGVASSSSTSAAARGGEGGRVLVLAATNRRGALDAALLRPGRLHESVELGVPGREDREGVLRVHAGRLPLAAGVDLARLSREDVSGGLTCADLEASCRDAAMMAVREDLHGAREVRPEHLRKALEDRVAGRRRTQRFTFSIGRSPSGAF